MHNSPRVLHLFRDDHRWLGRMVAFFVFVFAIASLPGCAGAPSTDVRTTSEIVFLDLPKFDTDLNAMLLRHRNTVEVDFYEPISPNHVPVRLQKWISAAEQWGGKIRVTAPPSDTVPKSPMVVASLLGGLWSSLKLLDDFKKERMYEATANRNVVITLDRDTHGQVVVKRVTFSMQE